jgi:hypothetical protein
MKDINEINDKNQIDLNYLSEFLLDKEDDLLDFLLQINHYKKIDYSSDLVQNYYLETAFIPKELWNYYSFCEKAVSINGLVIKFVPENYRTKEICEIAISQNGRALEYVPENLIDYSLCKKAISQDGYALKFVPENLIDYSLCEKAISQDGNAIKFVPKNLPEYYSLSEKAVYINGNAIRYVHIDFIDYPLCEKAMSNYGNLEDVPEEFINYTLLKLSYKNRRYDTKQFIMYNFYKCKEYIPQLVKDFPEDKEYFKRHLLQEYISKQVRKVLKESLETNKNYDKEIEIIENAPYSINYAAKEESPEDYENIVKILIDKNPKFISYINEENITGNICNYFLSKYPKLLNPNYIKYNVEINQTLINKILKKYPFLIKNLPLNLQTYRNFATALSSSGYALKDLYFKFRTYKLCKIAILNTPYAFYYVPLPKGERKKLYPELLHFYNDTVENDLMTKEQYYNLVKLTYLKNPHCVEYSATPTKYINKLKKELNLVNNMV